MTNWIVNYDGMANLGVQHTPTYRGYVVRVDSAPNPERWFTYAYDQEAERTSWIGATDTEDQARKVLERLVSEGWKCEIYVNDEIGHCSHEGVIVKHTWYERKKERIRLILCAAHSHVFKDWGALPVREFMDIYDGLEQDAPIIGPRITK